MVRAVAMLVTSKSIIIGQYGLISCNEFSYILQVLERFHCLTVKIMDYKNIN
jgi:hypothetical protein